MQPIYQKLLDADAWVDSSLFTIADRIRNGYEAYSVFMRRFRTRGIGRWFVELSCDGLTFGLAGHSKKYSPGMMRTRRFLRRS